MLYDVQYKYKVNILLLKEMYRMATTSVNIKKVLGEVTETINNLNHINIKNTKND